MRQCKVKQLAAEVISCRRRCEAGCTRGAGGLEWGLGIGRIISGIRESRSEAPGLDPKPQACTPKAWTQSPAALSVLRRRAV